MPTDVNAINSNSVRLGFIGAGLSSISVIVLFAFRDQIQNGLSQLLSTLDRDWIRNHLRLLSPHSSERLAIDRSSGTTSIMIPSATMIELKYGLLCAFGEFPLLGSTTELLAKLGFQLGGDLKNVPTDGDDRQWSPLIAALIHPFEKTPAKDAKMEHLSDVLLRSLDDVRDLRHRVEEMGETGIGGKTKQKSRKTRRSNHQVDSLEKQRAKLREKQNRNGAEEVLDDKSNAVVRDAWMRIARTYNSARILLFLFSEEQGIDMLADYGEGGEDTGIRALNKSVHKLSDAMEVLAISCTSAEIDGTNDDSQGGITIASKDAWEKSIKAAIRSRRDALPENAVSASSADECKDDDVTVDLVNDSVIELTDDDDSSCSDDTEKRAEAGVKKKKNDYMSERYGSWNDNIDKLMKDLVSTMNRTSGDEITELEQTFSALSVKDGNGGDSRHPVTTVVRDRAKHIDEQFSLIAGVTGSQEYEIRKKYLLSIEKLRHRVEQRMRQGRNNNNAFHDARLDVYGSCLSGLSLGKNADVDLSLTFSDAIEKKLDFEAGVFAAKKYSRHVTDIVYKIKRKLESSNRVGVGGNQRYGGPPLKEEFCNIEAVPRARVPVIKGVYTDANNPHSEDGSLHFDICLLNDIAVANSGLIKEYSDVDIRVKSLMIAIKRWTKDNKINAAQNNTLSSYTWMNMVIFYLQCIEFVPNLQCPSLMRDCKRGISARRQDNINNLNTAYLKWKGQADRFWRRSPDVDAAYSSVSILLYGFFRFYSQDFPYQLYLISIKRGRGTGLPKTMFPDRASLHFCIEDPFETYDSHFPHDLGTPADEMGSIFISRCFRNSTEHLRKLLFEEATQEDETVTELWPIATPAAKVSARLRRKRNIKPEHRDPNMTLVIELPVSARVDITREDIVDLFQPYAAVTNSNIVGSALTSSCKLAFVDYDSIKAVKAALMDHARKPLVWNDEALRISQKAMTMKNGPKGRSNEPKRDRTSAKKNNTAEKTTIPNNEPKIDPKKDAAKSVLPDGGKADTTKDNKSNKGKPDRTLVVQNISGNVSGEGLAKLFRPFADRTTSKLLSADLVKKKTMAFIEFDSPAAVKDALQEHSERPLIWNGKVLEIAQKMPAGWKKRVKVKGDGDGYKGTKTPEQPQSHANPSPKGRGGKNQGRKSKRGSGNNNNYNKPIVEANKSIQEQV